MNKNPFLWSFFILFLVGITPILPATNYYVDSDTGDDQRGGTSPETAWRSIEKVNDAPLIAGDHVLFRRDCVWRGNLVAKNGEEGNPIVYAAFGEGNKPVILGSVDLTDPDRWIPPTDPEGKIWTVRADSSNPSGRPDFDPDVGNIILTPKGKLPSDPDQKFVEDTNRFAAFKRWSLDDLKSQNDFWYDEEGKTLFFYSDRNPTELFDEIEAAINRHIVEVSRYAVVEDLALGYGAAHGVAGYDSKGCVIRNCDIFWIGGGQLKGFAEPTRFGNGVEFWSVGEDHLVENCRFREVYDVALTIQGREKTTYKNITWRNNEIHRCEQSFEIWLTDPESAVENALFERNRCYDAGFGWSHEQRPDKNGTHLLGYALNAKSIDFTIRDNLFVNAKNGMIMFWNDRVAEFSIDRNHWWQPETDGVAGSDQPLFQWSLSKDPIKVDYEEYKRLTGNDSHSVFAPPGE